MFKFLKDRPRIRDAIIVLTIVTGFALVDVWHYHDEPKTMQEYLPSSTTASAVP